MVYDAGDFCYAQRTSVKSNVCSPCYALTDLQSVRCAVPFLSTAFKHPKFPQRPLQLIQTQNKAQIHAKLSFIL